MAATTQPLGAFGFASVIGISKEISYGNAVTPSVYIPFASNQMTFTNKLTKRIGVRKTKGQTVAGPGQIETKGSFEVECEPDTIGLLLGLALGVDVVSTPASAVYAHTMKLASPLDSFTLSADFGKNSVHQFTGLKVDSLDFSVKPDGFLMAKFGVIGQTDIILPSQSLSPTFGNITPFAFEHLSSASSATINGTQYPVDSFSASLKNNLKPFYGSGSARMVRNINETAAAVTGSFTLPYESDAIANFALTGTPVALALTFTHTLIAAGSTPYSFVLNFPQVIFESAPLDPKKSDVTSYNVKFSAYESASGAQDDMNCVLTNTASAQYVP